MAIDIVMPKDNEAELLKMAEKLGFKELIFLYTDMSKTVPVQILSVQVIDSEPGLKKKQSFKKIKIFSAVLINNAKDFDKAKKNHNFVFAPAQRSFFEHKKIKYLINAEDMPADDFLYQRRAGLDDIMCRLAKDKDKIVIFNISLLEPAQSNKSSQSNTFHTQSKILARMIQNARLCRKYKVKTQIASFASAPIEMRAPNDLNGFARVLKVF